MFHLWKVKNKLHGHLSVPKIWTYFQNEQFVLFVTKHFKILQLNRKGNGAVKASRFFHLYLQS